MKRTKNSHSNKSHKKHSKYITRKIHGMFWRAYWQDKWTLIATYLARVPAILAYSIFIPLASAYGIQAIFESNMNGVYHAALWVVGLALVYCVLWAIGGIAAARNGVRGAKSVQNQVFANFLAKDYDFYTNSFFGSLGAQAIRINDACRSYGELVTRGVPQQAVIIIASLLVIAWQSLFLASITLAIMACILFFMLFSISWRLMFRRRTAKAYSVVAAHIGDALSHGATVKSFAAEGFEKEHLQKPLGRWGGEQFKSWIAILPAESGRMLLAAIATALLLIFSSQLYMQGAITLGIVVLIQLYVIRLVSSTAEISTMIRQYEEIMGNAYEPVETMLVSRSITDPEKPQKLKRSQTHTLELANVSYRYPEADTKQQAITDFSLHIKPGEKIGVVGYSGSGKTTLTKLLLRFMDINQGSITIDGKDIRDLKQHDVRSVISYVPQEPLLFHRTITENISYGSANATQKEVLQAATLAYVDEFVKDLPKGYETLVGERGVKLSGGQRQRIAIARALLKDSPILVLDEATSALDSQSERYIQKALWKLMKDRTALVVAHRLSTIQRMDRIVVMDKGKIVQVGTHQELLEDKNGIYAALWTHQSGGYIVEEVS